MTMTAPTEKLQCRFVYTRLGYSKYLSHLDMIGVITKAVRRASLPYAITAGITPRAVISFGPPLPLGHESLCEFFILDLTESIDPEEAKERLSEELPEGVIITEAIFPYSRRRQPNKGEMVEYELFFTTEKACEMAQNFLCPNRVFELESKGKLKAYSMEKALQSIARNDRDGLFILKVQFFQSIPDAPSVSKISTALERHLQEDEESIFLIRRLSITSL
ncbi:MAG: DUF2344 domain-containing protein [Candidatus Riflebacteria bacterium]|nr:DUF2344 domain-containing protein [Candidatus Riflebacteria bacterium]